MKPVYIIFLFLFIISCAGIKPAPDVPEKIIQKETGAPEESIIYNMPTISFVTKDSRQRMGYLSLTLTAGPPSIRNELTSSMDTLSAAINSLMCTKKAEDLDSVDDLEQLKLELQPALNQKLTTGHVLKVTIREIVVN